MKDDLLTVTEDELTEMLKNHIVKEIYPIDTPTSMDTQEEDDEELRNLPEHPGGDEAALRGNQGGETAQVEPLASASTLGMSLSASSPRGFCSMISRSLLVRSDIAWYWHWRYDDKRKMVRY